MDEPKSVKSTIRGKIVNIDHDKRTMFVRADTVGFIDHTLKWQPVMDDVLRKEKPKNRVAIEVVTDMTQESPQPFVVGIRFDENFRKNQSAYTDTQANEILIMSCFRTGARVVGCTLTPDTVTFDDMMDMLLNRAVEDAARIKREAKNL